jgi:hypothetical protein
LEGSGVQVQSDDGKTLSHIADFKSPFYQYGSSIQHMTNPKGLLEDLELYLKGLRKDKRGQLVKVTEPLLNEFGINRIMGIVYSIVNRVTIMSNVNKNELPILMLNFSDAIIQDLMENRLKFGVRNHVDCTIILIECQNVVFMCIKRGFEEGDRRFWKGSISETRITQDRAKQQQSFLSKLNPFAMGG